MTPWLSIVGIGEDGLSGLGEQARNLVDRADVLIGGARHLSMLPDDGRERLAWPSPLNRLVGEIEARRGQAVCVLATGDPFCFGIGTTLARRIPMSEMQVIPAPSAFSLACAQLGWSLPEVSLLTLHGRPTSLIVPAIQPDARLMVLSDNHETPTEVASLLCEKGFGASELHVLEHLGGSRERILHLRADQEDFPEFADFNMLAIVCKAGEGAEILPRIPGLPDDVFHHDGQLTKREVRAVTLSALMPGPGQVLWDVGAGCGSVAIEWMRTDPNARAVAIERQAARCEMITSNAARLGTPYLKLVSGEAPACLSDLQRPDAVFIGGGINTSGLFEACWQSLMPGGRLVANAVTLEGEARLASLQAEHGGELRRLSVSRAEAVGPFRGWRPAMPVTQFALVKSRDEG
ncbi:bifunctional cobalt-precorrin-7 (C(5))-methyltransferase/cobalt-precorrin-6B (C(15))-methyltransferase [Fodinicurvata fenggangensis]|uniref:bifunctional cobalt-precorrin-7 (C(5))-methyltransferase/cobalt-precorrin-6B (C(15))-methyltransferase n=1 Tax=Fodinicurvata fenggangensis TaxID=1121830 RepID=UPI00047C59CE|nr:bifunctional cobalt-precorrin-7 (C(5))-methyltransferase/cobalt-precorrin-6B (C(15))-methyltransferase [Fodinicurvata fenggangensis]